MSLEEKQSNSGQANSDPSQLAPLPATLTQWLHQWREGDFEALNRCFSMVYVDLKKSAEKKVWEHHLPITLTATELVGEVYVRLRERDEMLFQNRSQFFGFASVLMRDILVELFRKKQAVKRGAGQEFVSLDQAERLLGRNDLDPSQILDLDQALTKLEALDPRQARIVILRFFAGMGLEEVATMLGISSSTVKREWRYAKRWLSREMSR